MGPSGFGIISQLSNFYSLFVSIIHLGVPVSITSETAKLNSSNSINDKLKINSYFRYFISRILFATIFFTAFIIIFSVFLTDFLVENSNYYYFLIIIFISAPFGVIYSIIEAYLRSFQEIGNIVKINVFTNIISTLFLIPLIFYLKYLGVSIYLLLFGILPFSLLFIFSKEFIKNIYKKTDYRLSKSEKSLIFKIGSISLLSSLMYQGNIIIIRKLLILNYGYDENGIYQSVLSISISYFSLLYIFLTNYTLPKFSSCKSPESINKELNLNARFLLLIMIPMVMLILALKDFGIFLFFSKNFINARELFFPQFIGDIFRVGAALFGLWLISERKIKEIIIIDTIFNIVLFILSFLFISTFKFPLIFVSYAYLVSFFLHLIMYYSYSKYKLNFKIEKKVLKTVLYSVIAIIATYFISLYLINIALFLVIILIMIWFFMVIEKYEFIKIKSKYLSLVKNYTKS